jgi:hypothetical protein
MRDHDQEAPAEAGMRDGRAKVHAAMLEAASQKPTLAEMMVDVEGEAARIEIVQAGLIDAGHRAKPDSGQMSRLVILDRLVRFLRLVGRYEAEVRSLLQQLQQRDMTR